MSVALGDRIEGTEPRLQNPAIKASVSDEPDHRACVRAARAGDQLAFARLYDLYGRMVHGILMSRVPRNEVDDLVQDVFVTALRKLRSLRDDECLLQGHLRAFGGKGEQLGDAGVGEGIVGGRAHASWMAISATLPPFVVFRGRVSRAIAP